MSNTKEKYPVKMEYREKTIVLLDEALNRWAYLDEEGEPGKQYMTAAEVKAAIDRKLDTVKGKKFNRVKVWKRENPGTVYEVTSIKLGGYGGPTLRGTVVEALPPKKGEWNASKVGDKEHLDLENRYGSDLLFVEGNEELRASLITKDKEIERLKIERDAIKGGTKVTREFFAKRGDLDD